MDTVSEPDAERILRNAKRVKRAFRLIFYPGAAIVAFLLLSGSREPDGLRAGTTEQGYEFVMQFDGDQPIWFETSIRERCPNGHEVARQWASTQRLDAGDGRLDVMETRPSRWSNGQTGNLTMRLRARVDGDAVTGTLSIEDRLGRYVCEAETDFSAG